MQAALSSRTPGPDGCWWARPKLLLHTLFTSEHANPPPPPPPPPPLPTFFLLSFPPGGPHLKVRSSRCKQCCHVVSQARFLHGQVQAYQAELRPTVTLPREKITSLTLSYMQDLLHNECGALTSELRHRAHAVPSVCMRQGVATRLITADGGTYDEGADEPVAGVSYKTPDGEMHTVYAHLTVACDGMYSMLRKRLHERADSVRCARYNLSVQAL